MNKSILLILFCFFTLVSGKAQFRSITLGIDGLTCSMCSNTVERALMKLDFIKGVQMDLNENVAQITLNEGRPVSIAEVGKKVMDAGYSVRFIKAVFHFDDLPVQNHFVFPYEGNQYIFVHIPSVVLNGEKELLFIDKKWMARKDYPKWEAFLEEDRKINKAGKNTYHVTW